MAVAVLVVALGGCDRHMTRPAVAKVQFLLSATPATGSPPSPVTLLAHVVNVGDTRVWHCEGCGCGNGISVEVRGPDGHRVALEEPKASRPMCPDGFSPLERGGMLDGGNIFTGVLYEQDSPVYPTPTYQAPPGTYTVIALFGYRATGSGPEFVLERRVSFAWQP